MKKYYIMLAVIVLIILIKNNLPNANENMIIMRPDYNSEMDYLEFEVLDGSDKIPLEIDVEPVRLTASEANELFLQTREIIAQKIPSEIESGSIELITEVDGMDIFWLSSDESVIANDGAVNPYALNIGETKYVELVAVLSLDEYRYESEFEVEVKCNKPATIEQKKLWLNSRIKKYMENNSDIKEINLPESIDGIELEYGNKNETGFEIILIIILAAGGVFAAKKMEIKQQYKNKERQMEIDYCEIVSKLVMLMGAGLTIRNAWIKTVTDYEESKCNTGMRYAYEEMAVTVNELSAGIPERMIYENYGKRCKLPRYVKLGSLLQQNFIKGSKQLLTLLEEESDAAFEDRKLLAKKQGEEAGTKLLMPMMLELVAVMAIVMAPALLNF